MSTVEPTDYQSGDHSFNENSPRPPIPGEETEVSELGGCQSPAPGPSYSSWSAALKYNKGGSSPVLTPRRSSLTYNPSSIVDPGAPLGFEPEGSCTSGCGDGSFLEGGGSRSPPPYLRWARNLHSLLEDSEGVDLFHRYLIEEGRTHVDMLFFWFACEGLKKQRDQEKINQLVKVIHRRYFLKTQLAISEDLRKEINQRIKEGKDLLERDVFDNVQSEVERLINETTYPNFLKSDVYLQHVQVMQNGELSSGSSSGSSGSSSGGREMTGLGISSGMLPTLHEDAELVTTCSGGGSAMGGTPVVTHLHDPLPLTRDMLMATQKRRAVELRPKPEAYAGMYLQHAHYQYHPSHVHPAYSSYNPVSRQDSELQSLSSDARTESDNMSLTDSSVDGISVGRNRMTKKQHFWQSKQIKESACMNRDPCMHHTVIPRTQRIQKEQMHRMEPKQFAEVLIQKLEVVKRDQETQEKLERTLRDEDLVGNVDEPCIGDPTSAPRSLADAIRDKLMIDDDSDQAILDQHVSRVWSDLTPSRSPGLISPRPRSPEGRRRAACSSASAAAAAAAAAAILPSSKAMMGVGIAQYPIPPCAVNPSHFSSAGGVPHPYQSHSRTAYCPRYNRKEKDVFSTFSSDSGNVHDFTEGSEHKHYMPKSKSMPDYQEAQKQDSYSSLQGYDGRYRQSKDASRRSCSKKTLTDLTDSGVSVVSDSTPVVTTSTQSKDKVLSWLLESEKSSGTSHSHIEREGCMPKHRLRSSGASATSPVAPRHGRKPTAAYSNSRSGSLERAGGSGGTWCGPGPAQSFVAEPSMPPMSIPHTATQLEEARRRLLEEEGRKPGRQRYSTTVKTAGHGPMEASVSGQSTLKKGRSGRTGPLTGEGSSEFTTVVFSFCDEQFPYRTKIPGRPITLRQFKEYLPKKGSYRFFFKTECEDLDTKVIQEEITEDNDILPLWEGKVMGQVKPIE